jgi:hypothetical protein
MSAEDILGFAKTHAGKGYRSAYDPEDDRGDEGENIQGEETLREPKHRAKQKKINYHYSNEETGQPSAVTSTGLVSGSRAIKPVYCHYANRDQGHAKATHIFHTPATSVEGGVGYPLCPKHLSEEQEHLAKWRKNNPDVYVKSPEALTPDVTMRLHGEESGMKEDKRALMASYMVFGKNIHPDDERVLFGQNTPFVGPGRTPGTTKNPRVTDVTPEYKKTALNAALERARSGKGGRSSEELQKIGKSEEERRDYSTGYVKNPQGKLTRFYKPIGEAAKGKRKPIAKGNYVAKKDAALGEAPIEKVMSVAKEAKKHGTYLDKDIWHAIIENHGEGVVQPKHVVEHVKGQQIQKEFEAKNKGKKQGDLPIPRRAGAFATYAKNVAGAGEAEELKEEKANEDWFGYLSRDGEFRNQL